MERKIKIMLVLLVIFLSGCDTKIRWEKVLETKVVDIKIVGVGGWGSPNTVRIWKLDNGMTVSMSGWKNEDVCVGDTVAKYEVVSGIGKGMTMWQKVQL